MRPRSRPRGRRGVHEFHRDRGGATSLPAITLSIAPRSTFPPRLRRPTGFSSARSTCACLRSWPSSRSLTAISRASPNWSATSPGSSAEHWEDANPSAEGDDYSARIAQLAYARGQRSRPPAAPIRAVARRQPREGALSYRDQLGDGRRPAAFGYAATTERREADDGAGKVHAGKVDRAGLERRRDWKARRGRRHARKARRRRFSRSRRPRLNTSASRMRSPCRSSRHSSAT